jgi:hypothetical protein
VRETVKDSGISDRDAGMEQLLIQLEASGTRKVYECEHGFRYLDFSNVQSKLQSEEEQLRLESLRGCHS